MSDLFGEPPVNATAGNGHYAQAANLTYTDSDGSSPMSAPIVLQQKHRSREQSGSGSSRSPRSNLPAVKAEADNSMDEFPRSEDNTSKTPSSASTTRVHTAPNSPPPSKMGMTSAITTTSVASPAFGQAKTSASLPAADVLSVMDGMPDKATQQQASESSAVVRNVSRDSTASQLRQQCQLVVLGLPDEGSRSRVETQVKVGLTLLRPRSKSSNANHMTEPGIGHEDSVPYAMAYKDSKGALTLEADRYFEKVGSWKYLSLPTVSSVKRKAKKHYRASVPTDQTLFADIKVVSATNPSKEIYICQNCQQREMKRLQRKTQNRSKPSQDVESAGEDERGMTEMDLAKRKVCINV